MPARERSKSGIQARTDWRTGPFPALCSGRLHRAAPCPNKGADLDFWSALLVVPEARVPEFQSPRRLVWPVAKTACAVRLLRGRRLVRLRLQQTLFIFFLFLFFSILFRFFLFLSPLYRLQNSIAELTPAGLGG